MYFTKITIDIYILHNNNNNKSQILYLYCIRKLLKKSQKKKNSCKYINKIKNK